jgi:hypothetical protein
MRPVSKFAAGILAVVVAASSTQAALLFSDSFNYLDSTAIVGQTPTVGGAWAQTGTGTNGPVAVNNGAINIIQGPSSTYAQDVNAPFDGGYTAGVGSKLYASFDLTVTNAAATVTDVYFAHFLQGTSSFVERLYVTAPAADSGYRLALTNGSTALATNTGAVRSDDLAFGTTYKVVLSYDYDAKAGSLWINPTSESSASLTPTDTGFQTAVVAFAFRQGSPSGAVTTTQTIDNLLVGTTFGDVVSVPEPASIGLLGLGAVGLLRRRSSR